MLLALTIIVLLEKDVGIAYAVVTVEQPSGPVKAGRERSAV
jgi:hypothetical protein